MRTKVLTLSHIEAVLAQISDVLLDADVPLTVVQAFVDSIKQEALGQRLLASLKPNEQLLQLVRDKMVAFMGGKQTSFSFNMPAIVLVMGLQGAGKTSATAKLAHYIDKGSSKSGKKVKIVLASVDFNRPAAIEQLKQLADSAKVDFFKAQSSDTIEAVREINNFFNKQRYDILLLDTAGRLQLDNHLMNELGVVTDLIKPQYKLLVVDGMIGQESIQVAQAFENQVGFDGAIMTKMDSSARGGAAFSFSYTLKKRILFLAEGEKIVDLVPFDAERMAGRMLGMGDVQTLIDRADQKIKQADKDGMSQSFAQGKLTLRDFAKQLDMLGSLGSMSQVLKYLPGSIGNQISSVALQQGEVELKKFRAIFSSMSKKELAGACQMTDMRKKEVARGAGVVLADVTKLFQRYEQAQQYVKLLKNSSFMKSKPS